MQSDLQLLGIDVADAVGWWCSVLDDDDAIRHPQRKKKLMQSLIDTNAHPLLRHIDVEKRSCRCGESTVDVFSAEVGIIYVII